MNPSGATRKPKVWLFLLIPALIVGAVLLALRGSKKWPVAEADQVVETYVRLIAEERYDEAYEQCLSADYRRDVNREKFTEAHAEVRAERGALQQRELLRAESSVNLFSGVRSLQMLYRLTYPNEEVRDYVVVNDADGELRIEGTYRLSGSDGLTFRLW